MRYNQWRSHEVEVEGQRPPTLPLLSPLTAIGDLGERCKLPYRQGRHLRGLGPSPPRKKEKKKEKKEERKKRKKERKKKGKYE